MDLKVLQDIGMTEGEARVYETILNLGNSSTGPIINQSGITSSKVYIILERLEKKGLVSHVSKNNVKYFQVSDPRRLLDYMEEKKKKIEEKTEEIKKIIPLLESKRNSFKNIQETTMFQGIKGLKTALYEFIEDMSAGDEYVVLGAPSYFGENFENFIRQFYIEKERKGIKTRLIYNSSFKDVKRLYNGLKLTSIRFIENVTPSTIVIRQNKVLIISYGEDPRQVLISSKPIADSFYEFFESMWKLAKK